MALFSDQEVNTGRQPFLDVAKSLSIIFMASIHCVMGFCRPDSLGGPEDVWGSGFYGEIVGKILGGTFAAPVFMFAMGVGIAYSRSSDPASMARRGREIFLKGLLLNVLKALPFFLAPLFVRQSEELRNITLGLGVVGITTVDIMIFAGLAFLLLSLLTRIGLSCWTILAIAVGMSVFGEFVRELGFGNPIVDLAVSPFVGVSEWPAHSCFPLNSWFIFPAAGLVFGRMLRRCTAPGRFFAVVTPVALVVSAFIAVWTWSRMTSVEFYQMRLYVTVYAFGSIFTLAGICYFLTPHLGGRILSVVGEMSRMINEIYIIHWLIITALAAFLGYAGGIWLGTYGAQVAALAILVVSFFLARLWRSRKTRQV